MPKLSALKYRVSTKEFFFLKSQFREGFLVLGSWTFDHLRLFFKVLEERTVFKSLTFSETNKMKFMLFFAFCKMS